MSLLPRMCSVEDVARMVVAICGEQGKVLNVACIPTDNGWMAA